LDISNQVDHGKGFEWAVASAFNNLLQISLVDTKELRDAETRYSNLPSAKQASFKLCAEKAAAYVAEIEGLHRSPTGYVTLSQDAAGAQGDVRDVILHLGGREIGISCKTNHEAFKHSRLSAKIDFVKKWGLGEACSAEYWQAVRPLFGELARMRTESSGKMQWSEIESYQERFYLPVLEAWKGELLRIASGENDASKIAATALCRYIIGRIDFWKIVSRSDQVRLYAFNTHSTLGTNRTLLPNRILGIDNFDGSQYSMNVRMNEGYQFNFRLHNASSRVEPSLKFDVQSEGLPRHIHQHDILI
jgi:hypothetical protein